MTEALVTKEEKSPEVLAQEEITAQQDDLVKARAEAKNAGETEGDYIISEGLPEPFVFVRRYWGVGPLAYETKRGLIKVASGELIIRFAYHAHDPITGEDLPDTTETIVMTEEAFKALAPAAPPPPEALSVRAQRIGDKRRGTIPAGEKPKPDQTLPKPKPSPPQASQLPSQPPPRITTEPK